MKQDYIRENGEHASGPTKTCPKCGAGNLQEKRDDAPDFSESGWFYWLQYSCRKPTCLHQFKERMMVQQNGRTLR